MKLRTYLAYVLLLPSLMLAGAIISLCIILKYAHSAHIPLPLSIILSLILTFVFLLAPLMTFTFSKKAILESKKRLTSILIWLIYIFVVSSVVICVAFSSFSLDGILWGLILFTLPCTVTALSAYAIYSEKVNLQGRVEQKSDISRAVTESVCLCLVTTACICALKAVLNVFDWDITEATGGVQTVIICVHAYSAFVYGYNRFKKTKAFPKLEAIFVLVFSSVSTAVVLVINLIADKFSFEFDELMEEIIIGKNMYALLIVFIVIPVVTLCLGALLAKCTSNKKVSE